MVWVVGIRVDAPFLSHIYLVVGVLYAAETTSKILEGEMFKMTLSRPKNGNAQHLRVTQVVPLRSGFRPAIESLKEFYAVRNGS